MSFQVRDALHTVTRALPNGAAAVTSTALDTETVASGRQLADFEILIEAPAMGTTPMPNAKTMTYAVVTSANADLSGPTVIADAVLVQTGAAGAGCAAATARFRLPTNAARYVGVRATGSASGDATGSSATISFVF
jgi:hypothetical protein